MRRSGMGQRHAAMHRRSQAARRRTMRRRTRRRVQRHVRRQRRIRRRRMLLIGGAIVLGGAFAGYKLGQRNARTIEERSGRSVDEMSDEELQYYMQQYNIQPEPMTTDDQAYAAQMGESEDEEPDYVDQLERLARLRDEGVITEEEFQKKKTQLLAL